MKKQLAATLLIIALPFLMVSCVSSILKEKAPTFSKDIHFKEPQNFSKVNLSVYPAWKSNKTGNVISIISDCNDENATSLTGLHQLITGSLEEIKSVKQESITFKDHPALLFMTDGTLDGQPIIVRSMSFRRKNCGYVSSLSGKPTAIQTDVDAFNTFNESFSFE